MVGLSGGATAGGAVSAASCADLPSGMPLKLLVQPHRGCFPEKLRENSMGSFLLWYYTRVNPFRTAVLLWGPIQLELD